VIPLFLRNKIRWGRIGVSLLFFVRPCEQVRSQVAAKAPEVAILQIDPVFIFHNRAVHHRRRASATSFPRVIDPAPRCRVNSSARQNDLICAQASVIRQRSIVTRKADITSVALVPTPGARFGSRAASLRTSRDVRGADRAGAVILDRAAGPVMTRPVPPELPERKPAGEITVEEQQEYARELLEATRRELAELDRPHRKRRLRAGTGQAAKPGGVGAACRRPEAEARAGRQLGPARPGARSAVPTTASAAVLPGGLAPYGLPSDQALGIV
jgi:hypothetical protein